MSNAPWVTAERYIATAEDPEIRDGFTTFLQSVSDHGLGSVWQVDELTQDYDDAGTLRVYVATDLTATDMARNPYEGDQVVASGDRIEFDNLPSLPADRDYLNVYLEDGESLAGSLGGVAGQFSCANSDGCTFYTNHDREQGFYPSSSGGVTFTPTAGTAQMVAAFVPGAEAAADYLAFGYWLYVPDDLAQTDDYDFGVFASGGTPFETNNIVGLIGTATYAGDAVGMYYVNRSSQNPATGAFTADVELTADFGTAGEWGTVSGVVSSFSYEGDVAAMFPTTWELDTNIYSGFRNTHGIDHGERNIFGGDYSSNVIQAGGFVHGWTWVEDYNGEAWYGDWNAKFFGNGASSTDHPGSVAGTFNARQYYDSGTQDIDAANGADIGLSGSFAAHKQP